MENMEMENEESGPGIKDILKMLVRHWKMFVIMGLAGIISAGSLYFLSTPEYECQAKLMVRYLVERGGIDQEMKSEIKGTTYTASVINNEIEILKSWDLVRAVADDIGLARLVPNSPSPAAKELGARVVKKNLMVTPVRESNVIEISYRNKDRDLADQVLQKMINRYFDMHLTIHRSVGTGQFLEKRSMEVRERLQAIDEELNQLQADGGVMALGEKNLENIQKSKTEAISNLLAAEADRAGQQARIQSLEVLLHGVNTSAELGKEVSSKAPGVEVVTAYTQNLERLEALRKRSIEIRSKFAENNPVVQANQREIENLESRRLALAVKYPSLIVKTSPTNPGAPPIDLDNERALLAQIEGRIGILKAHLEELDEQHRNLPENLRRIKDLERARQIEEENVRYFEDTIEKARLDGALDPSLIPNISVVQGVSPPVAVANGLITKLVLLLAGGGFALAAAIAFLIDFVIDRRVREPDELVNKMHLPLLLSIPFFRSGMEEGDFRPYAAGLLAKLFFSKASLSSKAGPKLIGCTSIGEGAGVSTIAENLVAASRWGTEKALLIEVTASFNGPREPGEFSGGWIKKDRLRLSGESLTPKNIKVFMDQLKGTDYDIAIFDLPIVGTASPTFLLAGFLDEVLLIVDPTTAQRDSLKRSFEELAQVNPGVKCVFNKSGVPASESRPQREKKSAKQWPDPGLSAPATA